MSQELADLLGLFMIFSLGAYLGFRVARRARDAVEYERRQLLGQNRRKGDRAP